MHNYNYISNRFAIGRIMFSFCGLKKYLMKLIIDQRILWELDI